MKKLFLFALLFITCATFAQVKSDAEMGVYNNTNIKPNTTGAIKAQMHNNMNKYLIASKIHRDSITSVRILPGDTCIVVRYKTVTDTVCFVSRDEMVQRLNDLLDVDLTDVDSGDILRFDDESNLWKNVPMPDYAPLGDSSKWTLVPPDTIKTIYNVVVDSSLTLKENLYIPTTTATAGQIKQGGFPIFHTYSDAIGQPNLFIGQDAGNFTATGNLNVGIGEEALMVLTKGNENTVVGNNAGSGIDSTNSNTFIGFQAGATVNSNGNTAVGAWSGGAGYGSSVYGGYNTSIGYFALAYDTTGSNNIAIGHYAGAHNTLLSNRIYIGSGDKGSMANDTTQTLIYGNQDIDKLTINGDLTVTGQVKYDLIHAIGYLSAGSYTPNVTSNTPFKLAPGLNVTYNDGLTLLGDSITIITPGDYRIDMGVVFQGSNGDDFLFTIRVNGAVFASGNMALSTTGAGNYISGSWFYYIPYLAAGDDISFYVTNEGSSNDPTFRAFKYYIEKKPE